MKLLLIILTLFFLCGCSVTIIFAPKEVIVKDGNNSIEIKGSDLEGNKASQSSDGQIKIPWRQ